MPLHTHIQPYTYTPLPTNTHTYPIHTHIQPYTHIHSCTHTHAYTHTHMHIHTCLHTYAHTQLAYTYIHMHTHAHTNTCTWSYKETMSFYTHIQPPTHIHTYNPPHTHTHRKPSTSQGGNKFPVLGKYSQVSMRVRRRGGTVVTTNKGGSTPVRKTCCVFRRPLEESHTYATFAHTHLSLPLTIVKSKDMGMLLGQGGCLSQLGLL